jgi:hypothetical protein
MEGRGLGLGKGLERGLGKGSGKMEYRYVSLKNRQTVVHMMQMYK